MWSSRNRGGVVLLAAAAVLGILLLVGAGPLARTAPASGTASGAEPLPPPTRTTSVSVADLVVSVSVAPNRPGRNGFTVQAASSRRPPPAPIDAVVLRVGADTVRLEPTSPGVYFGTARLDRAGGIRLTAVLSRAGQRLSAPVAWSVDPEPPPAAAQRAGDGSGATTLRSTVVVLLPPLLGALALGVRRVVRARSRQPGGDAVQMLEGVS